MCKLKDITILILLIFCISTSVFSKEMCSWIPDEAYPEILRDNPNNHFYVVIGSDGRCEYGTGDNKEGALSECQKWKKENNINGICKPFAIGAEIVWEEKIKKKNEYENIQTEYQQKPGDFDYKYIFEDSSVWIDKNIITKKDPSSFINLEFVEKKEIKWWDQRSFIKTEKLYEIQQSKIFYDVFIFKASFKNSHDIFISVNSEFKTQKKAEKQASIYAKIYGQMPNFLKKNAKTLTIHKGDFLWMGGNEDVIIYVNLSKAHSEEAMFHELAHVSLDFNFGGSVDENAWKNVILQDKYYISRYAYDYFFQEDIAETTLWWFATKCKPHTISKKNYDKVIKHLPNRFEYLDKQDYDFYPAICE